MRMYLVTGGAGFIGSNIVAALGLRGVEVAVCDWLRTDERWRNLAKHEIAALIAPDELPDWLQRHGAALEAVIHMGAISAMTETNVDLIADRNVRSSLRLLDWCTENQVRLIYASSAATYGDGAAGFDDDYSTDALAKLRPLNAYGWSKHVVDRRIARLTALGRALPPQWVGLKFFNVYGPNEYHKGSMQSVIAKSYPLVRDGKPLCLFRSYRREHADGGQLRDFVYVRDCVEVVLWLLDHKEVSGLFNMGTGRARSWLDLAQALFAAARRPPAIEFIEMPPALIDHYQYFTEAHMHRLRVAGYRHAFTSLEDGISDYVRRYLAANDPYR
jgi:ADP-L-glycero-D-manno-heptose 6-epimerase